jgi:hypothetical protein
VTHKTYQCTGDLGDIIYCLPVIRQLGGGVLLLKSEPKVTRPLNQQLFDSLESIIRHQEYIKAVQWSRGERVDHDFTHFRQHYSPLRTLAETQGRFFGVKGIETWRPWLAAPAPILHGRPVIARSARYRNAQWAQIWPEVLLKYPNPLFIGLPEECAEFCERFGYVEHAPTKTFAEVANLIAGSSMFIGNQSSPYAIAEGLKSNCIQETHHWQRDCVYPRHNAAFISTYEEWVAVRDGRPESQGMILALQCHPGNAEQALALVDLICAIEPEKRKDVDFCLAMRRDTDQSVADRAKKLAEAKFEKVIIFRGNRMGTGWPSGPNDLWAELTMRLSIMRKEGKTSRDCVLTFEPDCVPLRADWINVLKAAWAQADGKGKDCIGTQETEPDHLNGNGVFRIGIARKWPALYGSAHTGWDCHHGRLLLTIGEDTPAITQRYQWQGYNRGDLEAVRKQGKIPALLHGTKGPEGVVFVRAMHEDGTLLARAC